MSIDLTAQKPSEGLVEGPYEVWIKTDQLGWFRSAIRATEEQAEDVADVLRKNFDEVDIRS